MTTSAPAGRRRSTGSRRFGYAMAAAVNLALLYLININPGWRVLSFLTARTPEVLGLVNLALAAGIVVRGLANRRE